MTRQASDEMTGWGKSLDDIQQTINGHMARARELARKGMFVSACYRDAQMTWAEQSAALAAREWWEARTQHQGGR